MPIHCLAESDLGWIENADRIPLRLAQALLRLLDRQPGRTLYTATCRSAAGPCALALDLAAACLTLSPAQGPPRRWRGEVLARLQHAARGAGFRP